MTLLKIKEILVDYIYESEEKFIEKIKKNANSIGAFECLKVFNIRTKTITFYNTSYTIIAKYDFNSKNKNSVRPYVKAKLGYSFNDGESSYFVKPDYRTNNRYEIKYSNGVYSGIGAGVQYGPFVLDLSYNINSFKTREKIEYNWGTRNNTLESKNHKTTIKAVTLSAGVVLDLSGF